MKFTGLKEIICIIGLLSAFFIIEPAAAQEKALFNLKQAADKPRLQIAFVELWSAYCTKPKSRYAQVSDARYFQSVCAAENGFAHHVSS